MTKSLFDNGSRNGRSVPTPLQTDEFFRRMQGEVHSRLNCISTEEHTGIPVGMQTELDRFTNYVKMDGRKRFMERYCIDNMFSAACPPKSRHCPDAVAPGALPAVSPVPLAA